MAVNQSGNLTGGVTGKMRIQGAVTGNARLQGSVNLSGAAFRQVISKTTAEWNANPQIVSSKDIIYVYTDYKVVDEQNVPNIKIGDGNAYLIDLPFVAPDGVTEEQIEFWNNKVSVRLDDTDPENMILYTD